ncbi:MAG TPA: MFS transporter [Streptosporangiaceae bacterium]
MSTTPPAAARFRLPAGVSFWVMATAYLGLMLAASAPSPLYVVYQHRFGFSALTLTMIFGVYALVLLAALLTVGGLSDFVGRKPVLLISLALMVVSMLVFARASGVAWLYAARILQGIAAGSSLGAVSAALIDYASPRQLPLAALMTSLIPSLGLALGAAVAGGLVQFAPDPTALVFVLLAIGFLAIMVAVALAGETVPRRPAGWRALRPRVAVSRAVRPEFASLVPGLIAPWAQVGFTLSLTTTLASVRFGITDRFLDGLVVAAVFGFAFVATLATRRVRPPRAIAAGCAGLIAGAAITLVSLAGPWDVPFYLGSVLTGLGAGATLGAVMRALAPLPAPAERGEFFAAVYVVGYLAFSLPAMIAGIFVVHAGLLATTVGYGIGVTVLSLAAIGSALRSAGRAEAGPAGPATAAMASRG